MTPDWIALQKLAHDEFTARVELITEWDRATPDRDWTVRDLVRHVVLEQQWVPPLLSGLSPLQARRTLAPLGADLAAEWRIYSAAATEAWQRTPVDVPVILAADTVTALDYLREQVSEVTIHAWDLAKATEANETLNETLIAAVWTVFEPKRDTLEASGLFASPLPIDEDAPLQSRLLALTGRDVRA